MSVKNRGNDVIPNQYSGKLVAIDGPNGAGKSTLIERLKIRFAELGVPSLFTREPSESEIGSFTRRFAEKSSGLPLAYLVGADRYFHLETEIIPKLQEGNYVFTDRYVLSSLILQRMDGVDSSVICEINNNAIKPDLQIVVWANENTLQARLGERECLTRFERGNKSGNELAFMKSGVRMLEEMGVICVHIRNDGNLDENVERIVHCVLELGDKNERILTY